MSDGCTSCGNKGGCDHRKTAMFAAIDEALLWLYPTRQFNLRRESLAAEPEGQGHEGDSQGQVPPPGLAPAPASGNLATVLAKQLATLVVELPPAADEYCRQLYVLCFGRHPCLIEALHGLALPAREDLENGTLEELYLRVLISDLVPFAAVQQVSVRGELLGDDLMIEELPRTGVFDPVLLPRMQKVVATLVDQGLRNLDFGEISAPPPGFDPGDYAERFGGVPAVANYFFYPHPCSLVTTTVVPFSAADRDVLSRVDAMEIAIGKDAVVV